MRNPLANGHFANHPPAGKPANAVGWPFDFPPTLAPELCAFLPNVFAVRRPSERPRLCPHTICLVAAAEIGDGEEVFLDYGLEMATDNPQGLPPWFAAARFRGDQVPRPSSAATTDREAQLDAAKVALLEWTQRFERDAGRKPNRHELTADPVAAALFAEFARLRDLEWPDEDENQGDGSGDTARPPR